MHQFKTQNVNGMQDPQSPYNILHEDYAKHGDIAITKNMPNAYSIPSKANQTLKTHYMVTIVCPLPDSVPQSGAAKPVADSTAAGSSAPSAPVTDSKQSSSIVHINKQTCCL